MGILDGFINKLGAAVASHITIDANRPIAEARSYRLGGQREQLRVGVGQFNDNLRSNYIGLIADRIVSQTIGNGVELDFEGDTETAQEQWVSKCLDANHQETLFHVSLLGAGEAGTGYWYIMPGGAFGENGAEYPRVVNVDPAFVRIETLPEDFDIVLRWVIEYKVTNAAGNEIGRRRVIEQDDGGAWYTRDYESTGQYSARWVLTQETLFPFDFPPMIHWKNLPTIDSVYGQPHITHNLIELQDRYNYTSSNLSKIIRYYGHPLRYAKMLGTSAQVEIGPDEMPNFNDPDGGIFQLEQLGDPIAILAFLKQLKQAMFDTSRVVDIESLQDRIGTLTNFGLRVIYQDNLAMIASKRELFGDALETLVQRLQIVGGMQPVPAEVVWPDALPVNAVEQQTAIAADLNAGILSKQTAAQLRGYDWEQERERMDMEEQAGYERLPDQ